MCGRYTLYDIDILPERFEVDMAEHQALKPEIKQRYNISPTQTVPTIISDGTKRHIELMRWGFIPHWAADPKSVFKYKTFNARSEDIFDKPTWKSAIRHKRCLVPTNGFYEWQTTDSGKQPFFIKPTDQQLFAFAGLYGTWKDPSEPDGPMWETYSIITTTPSKDMEGIHNRMPVILHPGDETLWLDPGNDSPDIIAQLMLPYDDGKLELYEVSREVNASRLDDKTLLAPLNSM